MDAIYRKELQNGLMKLSKLVQDLGVSKQRNDWIISMVLLVVLGNPSRKFWGSACSLYFHNPTKNSGQRRWLDGWIDLRCTVLTLFIMGLHPFLSHTQLSKILRSVLLFTWWVRLSRILCLSSLRFVFSFPVAVKCSWFCLLIWCLRHFTYCFLLSFLLVFRLTKFLTLFV